MIGPRDMEGQRPDVVPGVATAVECAGAEGVEPGMTDSLSLYLPRGEEDQPSRAVVPPDNQLLRSQSEDFASLLKEYHSLMPYPKQMVEPMRNELTQLGVDELRTPEEVDAVFEDDDGTVLLVINSVCGCAAGNARPAVAKALETEPQPDRSVTVFAGQDLEATERAREYLAGIPPSSPFFALFRNGQPVYIIERKHIEGRSADVIADDLIEAFEAYCGEEEPPADAPTRPDVSSSGSGDGLPSSFQSIT